MAGPDLTVLRHLLDEAQRVTDRQLAIAANMDDKAAAVLRFNAVVLGLLVAGGSLVLRTAGRQTGMTGLDRWSVLAGAVLLVISTIAAIAAYQVTRRSIGLQAEAMVASIGVDGAEPDYLTEAIRSYGDGIVANARYLEHTASLLQWALWLLGAALVGLAAAATSILGALGHV